MASVRPTQGETEADIARARLVRPAPSRADLRALHDRPSLSQAVLTRRSGFNPDAVRQYEQGRRAPTGPAATLLRMIAADPDAVARVLWGAAKATPGD